MYQTILIPLDGSERAEQILPHAKELARKFGADLQLIQVITPIYHMDSMESPSYYQVIVENTRRMRDEAHAYLAKLATELGKEDIDVTTRVEEGQAVECILAVAEEDDVDLIAMCSHGRTGLPRVFYGSVAAGILHSTNRPLLLIRAEENSSS